MCPLGITPREPFSGSCRRAYPAAILLSTAFALLGPTASARCLHHGVHDAFARDQLQLCCGSVFGVLGHMRGAAGFG